MTNYPYLKHAPRADASSVAGQMLPEGLCVLVVEDHADTRFMLRTMLERRGVKVLEAEDGEAAIHLAEDESPHLILMDGGLPRVDGLEAARLIRAHDGERRSRVPIVFLTGHAEASFQMKARAVGCDEFLIKPIDLDKLDDVLTRHLGTTGSA